jgi:hypothetical protein
MPKNDEPNPDTFMTTIRAFLLILSLAVCERVRGEDLVSLSESPQVEDRIKVAKVIGSERQSDKVQPLFCKLLGDSNLAVVAQTAMSLVAWSHDNHIPIELGKEAERLLLQRIHGLKPPGADGFGDSEQELWFVGVSALCLMKLYDQLPLKSMSDVREFEFEFCQPVTLAFVTRKKLQSKRCDELLLPLVNRVSDPQILMQIVRSFCEDWQSLPANQLEPVLMFIWRHPLLGESGVMHELVVPILSNSIDALKVASEGITDAYQKSNVEHVIRGVSRASTGGK